MHPGMIHWWNQRRAFAGHAGEEARGCGPGGGHHGHGGFGHPDRLRERAEAWEASGGPDFDGGGAGFGVRRPLRFLAYKLELDEAQVERLARILDELKIERAQAAVDHRRSTAGLADAVAGETLDAAALSAAAAERGKSAERLAQAVANALTKIHELLSPKQRAQLAYLIRTGTLAI
jgi:Spy/CpxP family protein refolding chaperone